MSEQPLLEVIFTAATHHYPPDHEQLRVPSHEVPFITTLRAPTSQLLYIFASSILDL